jgi:hypothetical protein
MGTDTEELKRMPRRKFTLRQSFVILTLACCLAWVMGHCSLVSRSQTHGLRFTFSRVQFFVGIDHGYPVTQYRIKEE